MNAQPWYRYRLKPEEKVSLKNRDPEDTGAFESGKEKARQVLKKLDRRLGELQEVLYGQHKHKILVVLQGMDTSGKDGVVRHVFNGVNPQGVKVFSFKAPTPQEKDHDFLWRIHPCVPARGEIVIFNRSHYEDVLAARVHELAEPKVLKSRYRSINDFERMLCQEGTTILKFFLHIDKDEQKERLAARLEERRKRWKFSPDDLSERKLWDKYMAAYEDALSLTSTDHAPWYVVPSNKKWYRNLTVASLLVETLESLDMRFPKIEPLVNKIK
jgi:PPK2 family polyphosphate:nucleotide phosphotransferase